MKFYLKQSINLFKTYLLGLLLFGILRLVYLLRFGETGIFSNYSSDLVAAFITGIRFDTQILCYVLALIFLLNFFLFIKIPKLQNSIVTFSKVYTIVIFALLTAIIIIDHQFYTYFKTHINILVFGFVEDDTSAVLASVWTDHPVIRVSIAFCIIVFVLYKIVSKIYSPPKELSKSPNTIASVLLMLLLTGVFFLGIRGSYGPFPLQIDDSTVSENQFINGLTLNGLFTLEKAIEERNESSKPIYQTDVLANSGYQSIKEVMADYYCLPIDSFPSANYLDYLFETTDSNSFLEKNPPNVVFVLMESFGGYYLNFHSAKLNLLGSLEKHIHEDLLFTNFLSSTQGTIYSLENILINKDYPLISSTNRRFESFQSSIAYPYLNAGYQTIFITGGKLGWRNLVDFLPHQYFKEAYGEETIVKNNPKVITNTWGVYDEYLFEEIFNRLSSPDKTPKLICALTTSNHTPYELPEHYQPYSVKISDSLKNQLLANQDIAEQNFTAYQYSNDCLGKFLTKLKASKYGANTIVAVSGDHNSYALFPHNNGKIKEQNNHIVPFFLFIPENYKKGLHINKNRYGSHKDIFPTLFNLSLSNSNYFSLGNNLLEVTKPDSLFYGINGGYYFGNPHLSKATLDKMVKARSVLNTYYFALP